MSNPAKTHLNKAVQINGFDHDDENLLLIWDDSAGKEPQVALKNDYSDPKTAHVLMDGVIVAHVRNGTTLTMSDIALLPLSAAATSGLAQL